MIPILIVIAIVLLLIFFVIGGYNALIKAKNKVKTNWSQIDVVMKRRADLIPNLVQTVKGYAQHESSTLENVVAARNRYLHAGSQQEQVRASGELSDALNRIMLLQENYPQLKADASFQNLQRNLTETEDKIQYARQFYNDAVYSYSNKKEMFPTSVIAGIFSFPSFELLKTDEKDREVPQIEF